MAKHAKPYVFSISELVALMKIIFNKVTAR